MGRTACPELQCLHKGPFYLYLYLFHACNNYVTMPDNIPIYNV